MQSKTTIVEVEGVRYQIRKMTPAVGTFIWQKLMGAMFKAAQAQAQAAKDAEPEPDAAKKEPTPDEKVRGLCGIAFMHMDYGDFEFTQNSCMKVISRLEPAANDAAIPIMTDGGAWAAPDVAEQPFLVTRLTVEAIAFNLAGFLAPSAVIQQPTT